MITPRNDNMERVDEEVEPAELVQQQLPDGAEDEQDVKQAPAEPADGDQPA